LHIGAQIEAHDESWRGSRQGLAIAMSATGLGVSGKPLRIDFANADTFSLGTNKRRVSDVVNVGLTPHATR